MQKSNFTSALKIAFIVETILNLINQFQPITSLNIENISLAKLTLNYCVPFFVSLYSSFVTDKRNEKLIPKNNS
jgi:hypothetical protein